MLAQVFNTIILFLCLLILILVIVALKINIQHTSARKKSKKKIKILKKFFAQTNRDKSEQLEKIKLSEEMTFKWNTINNKLNSDIFKLNRDLFEIVSKNKLS